MSPQQALQILTEVGVQFKGTLQDHKNIQSALSVFNALVTKEEAQQEGIKDPTQEDTTKNQTEGSEETTEE